MRETLLKKIIQVILFCTVCVTACRQNAKLYRIGFKCFTGLFKKYTVCVCKCDMIYMPHAYVCGRLITYLCVRVCGWGNCMPGSVVLSVGARTHTFVGLDVVLYAYGWIWPFQHSTRSKQAKNSLTLTEIDSLFALLLFVPILSGLKYIILITLPYGMCLQPLL